MIQLDYGVWLVTRAEWGARPPDSVTGLSVDTDTNHWGGPGFGAPFPHESCPAKVRAWQNFHMDARGWTDIAYNAVACPHGYVFEGRGRGRRSAANGTTAGNSGSYATCYLGGEGDEFTEAGKRAMKASGNWLTRAGSRRLGHRDWKPTACPGDTIYLWVQAGQPVQWSPAPPPEPERNPLEEDDMPYILAGDHVGNYYVDGSGATPIFEQALINQLVAQKVPVVNISAATSDQEMLIVNDRLAGTDEAARNAAVEGALRLAAIQQIEEREEQRDLAAEA